MGVSVSQCADCFRPSHEFSQPLIPAPASEIEKPSTSNSDCLSETGFESSELVASEFDSSLLLKQSEEATAEFMKLIHSLGSQKFEMNYEKEDFKVRTADTERCFLMWAEFKLPFGARQFMDFIKNIDRRPEWDTNLASSRLVYEAGNDTLVSHQIFKGALAVKSRDMLILSCYRKFDEAYFEVSQSITSEHYPPNPGYVRATLVIGGYHVIPIDANSCVVNSVSEIDLGGALPRSIVKKLSAMQYPRFVSSLTKAMSSRFTS